MCSSWTDWVWSFAIINAWKKVYIRYCVAILAISKAEIGTDADLVKDIASHSAILFLVTPCMRRRMCSSWTDWVWSFVIIGDWQKMAKNGDQRDYLVSGCIASHSSSFQSVMIPIDFWWLQKSFSASSPSGSPSNWPCYLISPFCRRCGR